MLLIVYKSDAEYTTWYFRTRSKKISYKRKFWVDYLCRWKVKKIIWSIFAIGSRRDDKMRPAGFEPATYCLEGSCSIQMSYDLLNSQCSLQICYMYTIGVKKSQGLFSAAEIARLKNATSLLTQTSLIDVCAIAHEFNGLKNWYFVRLLNFKEPIVQTHQAVFLTLPQKNWYHSTGTAKDGCGKRISQNYLIKNHS